MMAVGAPDGRSGLRQIQVLVDEALQAAGPGFDAEENVPATGPGHEGDQLGVDAIGSGAATPLKSFSAGQHGLTEGDDPFAVRGKHVVDECELFDAVDLPDRSHLLNAPLGRLEAKAPAEKVVGRAKRAGKRAAASELERHGAAI